MYSILFYFLLALLAFVILADYIGSRDLQAYRSKKLEHFVPYKSIAKKKKEVIHSPEKKGKTNWNKLVDDSNKSYKTKSFEAPI